MGNRASFSPGMGAHLLPKPAWPADEAPPRRARVLLVDDSRHDIILAKYFLLGSGGVDCELSTAQSSAAAMDTLRQAVDAGKAIDLVLLDINMPGDDGFALLDRIRTDPQLRRTPVIMCTGSGLDIDRSQARYLGAVGYMQKPPSPEKFRDILERLPVLDVLEGDSGVKLTAIAQDMAVPA